MQRMKFVCAVIVSIASVQSCWFQKAVAQEIDSFTEIDRKSVV